MKGDNPCPTHVMFDYIVHDNMQASSLKNDCLFSLKFY